MDEKPKWYKKIEDAKKKFMVKLRTEVSWTSDERRDEMISAFEEAMEQAYIAGAESVCDRLINELGLNAGR